MTAPDGGLRNPNEIIPVPSPNLAGLTIILVRTQGPINLGMVARVCGNMGVTDLRLVAPIAEHNCEDSRKFSTHSRDLLLGARVYPDLTSATADCQLVIGTSARFRDSELGASIAPQEVTTLLSERPAERWALVFGNEADGLDTAELRCCQAWVHLETFGENSSYNLANAVAITTYVIATCGIPPVRGENAPGAPREAISALYDYWLGTLDRIHYFRRADVERFRPMLTRMLSRWHLTMTDVQALRGMLAQVNFHSFGRRFDRLDLEATVSPEPEPPAGRE
jgi:TrmH family RNA methyltransferase